MTTVIKIENLYKEYKLGVIGHATLYRSIQSWWSKVRGKEDPNTLIGHNSVELNKKNILALNNINLEVEKGEILGIIGKNGAGKSTLLKVLSRVTAPTSGVIKGKGRIASLLEVGTGFHPELTGRENIFLNGAINGMTKNEILRKIDEIVKFAGVEKFVDTPVKRYSSGMRVRLGFSVAAHLDSEILVVDEVLSVGDAEFQKKCITKMNNVAKTGRTVFFVSHIMTSVRRLCNRTILIEKGKIIKDGNTDEVISYYLDNLSTNRGEKIFQYNKTQLEIDCKYVKINSIRSLNKSREINDIFSVRDNIYIELNYDIFFETDAMSVEIRLFNQRNETVFFTYDDQNLRKIEQLKRKPGNYTSICEISKDLLNDGHYTVQVTIGDRANVYFEGEHLIAFTVEDLHDIDGSRGIWTFGTDGLWPPSVIRPKIKWSREYKENGK